ncbi:MAG: hypothetical protein B9S32_07675 [Verrucomicrobia bacterium Tous-C9LFEB]|nr:MAG: hypothetical protein B9S32_07675 [Verrucomicrobia bacterium Tous-C9LFEB]
MREATLRSRILIPAWLITQVVSWTGIVLVFLFRELGLGGTMGYSGHMIFYYLYTNLELPALILNISFLIGVVLLWRYSFLSNSGCIASIRWIGTKGTGTLCLVVAVGMVTWLGSGLVFHGYALSMDEFCGNFQASIFAAGQRHAVIPPEWIPYNKALKPIFINYNETEHVWVANYLPVYAFVRSLFIRIGAPSLMNPLLAAGTILLVMQIIRNLWPTEKMYSLIGGLLLATNSAFLLTSMSLYSMSLSLFLNVTWLYLYTRNDRLGYGLAPWVGCLGLLVHQPFAHALFVLPFLLRMALERRWVRSAYFAAVYLLGLLGCALWWELESNPGAVSNGIKLFVLPSLFDFVTLIAATVQLVSWSTPVLALLFILSFGGESDHNRSLCADLRWGCLLISIFYIFMPFTQGHGWGNRYFYPAWGNVIILAVFGWQRLTRIIPEAENKALRIMVFTLIFAWGVQLPLRCWQVEGFARPYATAMKALESLPVDIVLLNPGQSFYAQDLVRNAPFLDRNPKMMRIDSLTPLQIAALQEKYRVAIIDRSNLIKFGICPSKTRHKP